MNWFDNLTRGAKILILIERKLTFTPKQLGEKLGVSTRTVAKEITQLNKDLKGTARIELNRGQYRIYFFDIPSYAEIKESILQPIENFDFQQNRMAYIFKNLLNSNHFLLIDDLAFNMNVSRTTINNDLNKLKNILRQYEIKILGKPNTGLKISGNEYKIRKFILENIYSLIYKTDILDSDIEDEINRLLHDYGLEKSIIDLFKQYLSISLDRYLNNHEIVFDSDKFKDLKKEKFLEIVLKINLLLINHLGIDLPENEKLFLIIPLIGMRTPVDLEIVSNFINVTPEVIKLVDSIINDIQEETDLSFKFNDTLDEFIYHIVFLTNRIKYGMKVQNSIKDELKKKYGLAWNLAERTAKVILKETGYEVNEDEIGFLTTYYQVVLQEQESKKKKKLKILVIHQMGGASMRLIAFQLKKILDEDSQIDMRANRPENINDLDDYDLIITTDNSDLDSNIPIIHLDEVTDDKYLRKEIERISYNNRLNLPSKIGGHSILLTLLDEEKIFVFDENDSYENIISVMTNSAIEQKLADDNFEERLKEREKKSTMKFSETVSFPHTIQNLNNQPFAMLGLIPEGLNDKNYDNLKVIIMTGLPESANDDLTLVQLYEEIVKISENETVINNLSQLSSYQDILNYFIIVNPIFDISR